jgi:hypothetical protein
MAALRLKKKAEHGKLSLFLLSLNSTYGTIEDGTEMSELKPKL